MSRFNSVLIGLALALVTVLALEIGEAVARYHRTSPPQPASVVR